MATAATLTEVLTAWPLAFLVGLGVGLWLSSRYRIVPARQMTEDERG